MDSLSPVISINLDLVMERYSIDTVTKGMTEDFKSGYVRRYPFFKISSYAGWVRDMLEKDLKDDHNLVMKGSRRDSVPNAVNRSERETRSYFVDKKYQMEVSYRVMDNKSNEIIEKDFQIAVVNDSNAALTKDVWKFKEKLERGNIR